VYESYQKMVTKQLSAQNLEMPFEPPTLRLFTMRATPNFFAVLEILIAIPLV